MTDQAQIKEYKGYNGTLILTDTGVIIKRGVKGFLLGGGMLRGDKTIPYKSIVAVQLKRAGLTAGYLQLTLVGGSEAKAGLFQSTKDENTINFHGNNDKFEEAKKEIEERISADSNKPQHNPINDLEKLADLKDKGIITEEEFNQKKKQILGIIKSATRGVNQTMDNTTTNTYHDPYEGQKSSYAQFGIGVWVVYGIFKLFTGGLSGIVTMGIYFVAGLFIASFASILPYMLMRAIAKAMAKAHTSDTIAVLTSYVLLAVNVVWIYFVAKMFLGFINGI